jgi:uncharacterized membrane protein YcaP (DUF421 family)
LISVKPILRIAAYSSSSSIPFRIMEGIRERGYADLERVRLAILEIDGVISVIPVERKAERGQERG